MICDRCRQEIKKDKDEQFKLEHLYTGHENKENDYWDLCRDCGKAIIDFVEKRG